MSKTKRTNVPISFRKRNQNVLVSFPNLSYWKPIVLIWSRIWSPGPNRNELFRCDKLGNELNLFGFIYTVNILQKTTPRIFVHPLHRKQARIFSDEIWEICTMKNTTPESSAMLRAGWPSFEKELGQLGVSKKALIPHPSSLIPHPRWSLAKLYSSRMTTGWGIRWGRRIMSRRASYVDVRYARVS